jgi:hypothetical protein
MHIHMSGMHPGAADLYSAGGAAKSAAAQRAAEVRKKLARGAQEIDGESTPEESLLIGQWVDSRHSQVLGEDQYHAAEAGKDPEFG